MSFIQYCSFIFATTGIIFQFWWTDQCWSSGRLVLWSERGEGNRLWISLQPDMLQFGSWSWFLIDPTRKNDTVFRCSLLLFCDFNCLPWDPDLFSWMGPLAQIWSIYLYLRTVEIFYRGKPALPVLMPSLHWPDPSLLETGEGMIFFTGTRIRWMVRLTERVHLHQSKKKNHHMVIIFKIRSEVKKIILCLWYSSQ